MENIMTMSSPEHYTNISSKREKNNRTKHVHQFMLYLTVTLESEKLNIKYYKFSDKVKFIMQKKVYERRLVYQYLEYS